MGVAVRLLTDRLSTVDCDTPADRSSALKTAAKSLLKVFGAVSAASTLAVRAAACAGGTVITKAIAKTPTSRLTSSLRRRVSVTVTWTLSTGMLKWMANDSGAVLSIIAMFTPGAVMVTDPW